MRNSPWPAVPFLAGFLFPPLVIFCLADGGWWTLAPVATLFGAVPLVDALAGLTDDARQSPDIDRNPWFRLVTWAWAPVHLALLVWTLTYASHGGRSALEIAGATLSMGAVAGAVGFTFAHELVHRRSAFERALGEIVLATVGYSHFAIEHVHGHHRHVATPLDPATARLGESFYRFLPRTVRGSASSAWRLECQRLARRGLGPWSLPNRMIRYGVTQAVLYAAIGWWYGAVGVLVLAGQAALAVTLLEVVNYVEHYGLTRREVAPGEYERIAPQHSWDSAHRISGWLLVHLTRHSDHHCVTSKRYQSLELLPQAPQLPAGYGAMFLLALVPPLWFRVMNPLAEQARTTPAPAAPWS